MSSEIGEPVKSLVDSVLNDEWEASVDTENMLLLDHNTHALQLNFAKITTKNVVGDVEQSFIHLVDAEWMKPAEKRHAEEQLNDWWAKKRKVLDEERHAEARNRFMILVKEV